MIQDFVLMGPEVLFCQMDILWNLHPDDHFLSQFPGFLSCLRNTTELSNLGWKCSGKSSKLSIEV